MHPVYKDMENNSKKLSFHYCHLPIPCVTVLQNPTVSQLGVNRIIFVLEKRFLPLADATHVKQNVCQTKVDDMVENFAVHNSLPRTCRVLALIYIRSAYIYCIM